MIDKDKRKAEIKTIILGCIEGNQDWPDDMADAIIAQEQSMIEKLEAQRELMLEALKAIDEAINDNCISDAQMIIKNIIKQVSGEQEG